MRLAAAIGVVAVALAAAVYVHQRHLVVANPSQSTGSAYFGTPSAAARVHPSWEDPVAVLLALGGVAAAAAILTVGRSGGLVRSDAGVERRQVLE